MRNLRCNGVARQRLYAPAEPMGAQSSAQARDAEPQSSMRPGWPQGQPPDMVWGSDRGLQATLQVRACARTCMHQSPTCGMQALSPGCTTVCSLA